MTRVRNILNIRTFQRLSSLDCTLRMWEAGGGRGGTITLRVGEATAILCRDALLFFTRPRLAGLGLSLSFISLSLLCSLSTTFGLSSSLDPLPLYPSCLSGPSSTSTQHQHRTPCTLDSRPICLLPQITRQNAASLLQHPFVSSSRLKPLTFFIFLHSVSMY